MFGFVLSVLTLLSLHGNVDTVSVITTPGVVTAVRQTVEIGRIASPATTIGIGEIAELHITTQKTLSAIVPSLHIPDYGTGMTSTIYMRGMGSRMENPVLGLYIDDIPIIDKNTYDIPMLGLSGMTLLRGPQGTVYGRNSMGGVLSLHTLSPSSFKGTKALIEWGTANTASATVSHYRGKDALTIGFHHTDGFFDNVFTGKKADPGNGVDLRWKREFGSGEWNLTNTAVASFSDEGGFAYGRFLDGELQRVNYDGKAGYTRLSVMDGLKAGKSFDKASLNLIGSVQLLADRMRMDQDYSPESIFSLEQSQRSAALTFEAILKPFHSDERWHSTTGLFFMGKFNHMDAPVNFFRDGIESLILENANKNIPESIGYIDFMMDTLPVSSVFGIWTGDLALYHESVLSLGRWDLTAGLRLDLEGGLMNYDCASDITYRFFPTMRSPKILPCTYRGDENHLGFEILPKLSAMYNGPSHGLKLYGTVSKGYKAGGFNTQIFSDIMQSVMMNALMDDLGVHFDEEFQSVGAGNTEYKPEEAWNFEAGIRISPAEWFRLEASLYNILIRNQQLTVFPPGKSIGRMMTNAGRSRSTGAEVETDLRKGGFHGMLSYGWNDARFTSFHDGNAEYSGNKVPYVPSQTLFAMAEYSFAIGGKALKEISLQASANGTGEIYWNEANTIKEPFHLLLGGMVSFSFPKATVFLRGDNLTGEKYRTFYFKSIGNEFFQSGKPRRITMGVSLNFPKR